MTIDMKVLENNFTISLTSKRRVAIVGAGPSGIVSAREAIAHGVEPVVFEATDRIGGLWYYTPEGSEPSVMKSTVINTSKEMTSFSSYIPPAHFANFMHNKQLLEYLCLFGQSFHIENYLRLQHKVISVCRSTNYAKDGCWIVTYRKPDGSECEEKFEGVLLCKGYFTHPYFPPKWPGQDNFRGQITHTGTYKNHNGFEDKTVVVVGIGNSAVDVAVELSRIAKQVYLSTRRGAWVIHRNYDNSIPIDLIVNNRWRYHLQKTLPPKWSSWYYQRIFNRRLHHEKFGLKPEHGIFNALFTVNDDLPNRLFCGSILIKPNIQEFTETGIIFPDGTQLNNVDHVVLATGYSIDFNMIEAGSLIPVKANCTSLYLNIYPPELHEHNSLGLVGCFQTPGSILPIAEMQARLFFQVFANELKLPDKEGMLTDIELHRAAISARFTVNSQRHTNIVSYIAYMDKLAAMIGCQPKICRYFFTDQKLFRAVFFGPNASYVYRLEGPGKFEHARDTVINLNQRVLAGMRGVELPSSEKNPNNALHGADVEKGITNSNKNPKNKSSWKLWILSGLNLFLLIAVVILVFFLAFHDRNIRTHHKFFS